MQDAPSLDALRQTIDSLDSKIIELLNQRYEAVIQIGDYKRQNHLPVYDPTRQNLVMEKISGQNRGPMPQATLNAIYREIISGAIRLEQPLKVAFLGPLGTFSHQAALAAFGHGCELEAVKSIPDVFRAIECERADYGCVPIENSAEGVINYTLDWLMRSSVRITSEIRCRVHHSLLGNIEIPAIRNIYSHPQVLGQCRGYLLEKFPGADLIECASTAQAAQRAAEDPAGAALGSPIAASLYHLGILAENVEDSSFNTTRFLVLGNQMTPPSGDDKTSICFVVKDRPGALYEALDPFRRAKLQLTMIESRPWQPQQGWEYCFFVDIVGHRDNPAIAEACAELEKISAFFKILGSYPRVS